MPVNFYDAKSLVDPVGVGTFGGEDDGRWRGCPSREHARSARSIERIGVGGTLGAKRERERERNWLPRQLAKRERLSLIDAGVGSSHPCCFPSWIRTPSTTALQRLCVSHFRASRKMIQGWTRETISFYNRRTFAEWLPMVLRVMRIVNIPCILFRNMNWPFNL